MKTSILKLKKSIQALSTEYLFSLYLYTTRISLIYKNLTPIKSVLNGNDLAILDKYLKSNQIFYFSVSKNCLKIRNMFSHFYSKRKIKKIFYTLMILMNLKKNLKDNY